MNISKFCGHLSAPQRLVRPIGAVLALALAGCASPYSFAPSQADATATIRPQSEAAIPEAPLAAASPPAPLAASSPPASVVPQRALKPLSGKFGGPNILVENQWSSTIQYSTTVDGNCQPWIPAKGTVGAGAHEMMKGQPRFQCGAQISFGPASTAAAGGAQACILHWAGDLFLLQQGASTDCDFSVDAAGITFYYRQ